MKRDLIIFTVGLLAVLFCSVTAVRYIAPVFSISKSNPPSLILDAGHGGEDGGASSASGHKESDINLDIVLKLESLFAFLGVETTLIRNDDISVHDPGCETLREKKVSDLKNRVKLIHNIQNPMLISVHQNTFTDPRYKGSQVFYGDGEVSGQWGEYTQGLFSSMLDQSNTRKAMPIPDNIYLFSHIDCPAILVECGFLSNGEEAALLLTDTYQRKITLVLAGAYLHQLEMIPTPLGGD